MTQSTENQEQTIARYAAGPSLLESTIQGLDQTQLDLSLSQESWSIREIVHHIADGDTLWKEFILRAAGNPEMEFTLAWYWHIPQDEWVQRWAYAQRDIAPSLALFAASRRHTVELLEAIPWLWEKTLLIPTRQGGHERASVAEVVEMQSRHVEGHVEEIRQIRTAHGV
jgi:hypothetical protein